MFIGDDNPPLFVPNPSHAESCSCAGATSCIGRTLVISNAKQLIPMEGEKELLAKLREEDDVGCDSASLDIRATCLAARYHVSHFSAKAGGIERDIRSRRSGSTSHIHSRTS